jgi:hypothetical protein
LLRLLDHRLFALKLTAPPAAGTNPLAKNPFPAYRKKPRTM